MLGIDFSQVNRSLMIKLALMHVFIIGLANYVVQFGGIIPIVDLKLTWGMFVFPLVVVATDLTVRLTNKYLARAVVGAAFVPDIIISGFIADWRIGFASAFAYLIGQLFDITIFQRIRERMTDMWWVAPALSTVVANVVDTYLFFWAAFAGGTNEFMAANWLEIATVDVFFKIGTSLIVFLPVYGILLSYLRKRMLVD